MPGVREPEPAMNHLHLYNHRKVIERRHETIATAPKTRAQAPSDARIDGASIKRP